MPSIPQRLYNEVMMSDNFICVYCGKRTPDVGIDHVIPRSQGGPDTLHNLVACCPPCNSHKSDRQLHEARMELRFGRFTRPTKSAARRPASLLPLPPIIRPQMSREDRIVRIVELAKEKVSGGYYRYSANAILKMVGGTAADVKAQVAAIRGPAKPRVASTHLERPANGW